jgi:hypothetical protein
MLAFAKMSIYGEKVESEGGDLAAKNCAKLRLNFKLNIRPVMKDFVTENRCSKKTHEKSYFSKRLGSFTNERNKCISLISLQLTILFGLFAGDCKI